MSSPLSSLLNLRHRTRFSTWRGRNGRRPGGLVTALEVDGPILRLAQGTFRENRAVITRLEVGHLNLAAAGPVEAELLGAAVAGALKDLRVKPAQVAMGIPRHLVVLRTLSLPLVKDAREMASIVHLQVAKDLPFPAEEAVIDFKLLEPHSPASGHQAVPSEAQTGSKVEVLVAVVRRESVAYYEKVAAAAQLKLTALGWLSEANARLLVACQAVPADATAAVVSLRPDEVGIDVLAGSSLVFSRGAAIPPRPESSSGETPPLEPGAEQGSRPADPFVDAVTIEVVRSLHSHGGAEAAAPVGRLVIAGATGREQAVLEALQQRLSIPCTRLDPGEALNLPGLGRQYAAGAIGVLGLVLGLADSAGLPMDFLNPKRPAVQRNTRRIRMLALSAAGAAVVIGLLGMRTHLIEERMKGSRELQQELAQGEKQLPVYRRMQQQAATVQNWAKQGRDWLEHYAYLSAVLPGCGDLYITSLTVSGQGHIHLAVQARSGEILADLDRQLRAAGYEVKPLAITPGKDRHGYNFRSTVELVVPAQMKMDFSKVRPPVRPDGDTEPGPKPERQRGGRS